MAHPSRPNVPHSPTLTLRRPSRGKRVHPVKHLGHRATSVKFSHKRRSGSFSLYSKPRSPLHSKSSAISHNYLGATGKETIKKQLPFLSRSNIKGENHTQLIAAGFFPLKSAFPQGDIVKTGTLRSISSGKNSQTMPRLWGRPRFKARGRPKHFTTPHAGQLSRSNSSSSTITHSKVNPSGHASEQNTSSNNLSSVRSLHKKHVYVPGPIALNKKSTSPPYENPTQQCKVSPSELCSEENGDLNKMDATSDDELADDVVDFFDYCNIEDFSLDFGRLSARPKFSIVPNRSPRQETPENFDLNTTSDSAAIELSAVASFESERIPTIAIRRPSNDEGWRSAPDLPLKEKDGLNAEERLKPVARGSVESLRRTVSTRRSRLLRLASFL